MIDTMLDFVIDSYRRIGRIPYQAHVQSVAEILRDALDASGELARDPRHAIDLQVAAVGHDLYEDTKVPADEIRSRFGARVDHLIEGMTNRSGAPGRAAYIAQLRHTDEGVRLIKIADLIDNALSCAYGIQDLGAPWVRDTFLPMTTELSEIVASIEYKQFPKTATLLLSWLQFAMQRLRANLQIMQSREGGGLPGAKQRGIFLDAVAKLIPTDPARTGDGG